MLVGPPPTSSPAPSSLRLAGSTTPTCCSSTAREAGASSSWTRRRVSRSPRRSSGWRRSWPAFPRCSIASTNCARSWGTTLSSKRPRSERKGGGEERPRGGRESIEGGEGQRGNGRMRNPSEVCWFYLQAQFILCLFSLSLRAPPPLKRGRALIKACFVFSLPLFLSHPSFALLQPERWREGSEADSQVLSLPSCTLGCRFLEVFIFSEHPYQDQNRFFFL